MSELTIERSVSIAASPQEVFSFVVTPGWFINDGSYREHRIDTISGRDFVVHDEAHGAFEFRVLTRDEPEYVSFRVSQQPEAGSTLVEFFVRPEGQGTQLTVRESGFESLSDDESQVRKAVEDNTAGWELELGVAKAQFEGGQS